MKELTKEKLQDYCYEDIKGDALTIIRLITDAYSIGKNKNIEDMFCQVSEDEFNNRYFLNIDWKSIINIAISATSRQETYKYLNREITG